MKLYILFLLCAVSAFAYFPLKTGTYMLMGESSKCGGRAYRGELTIAEQGNNYWVTWTVGNNEIRSGVGILCKDVFSVAFQDTFSNWGVASYSFIKEGELTGRWAFNNESCQNTEYLVWKSL